MREVSSLKLDLKSLVRDARDHAANGRFVLAREALKAVLERQPNNASAKKEFARLAKPLKTKSAPADVVRDATNMLRNREPATRIQAMAQGHQGDVNLWNLCGLAHQSEQNSAGAISAFRKVVTLAPTSPEGHLNLGNAYRAAEREEEAEAALRYAIRLKPDYAKPHNTLGNLLNSQGRVEEALGAFQTAVELDGAYINALKSLAVVSLNLGDKAGAADAAERCIRGAQAARTQSPELRADMAEAFRILSMCRDIGADKKVMKDLEALFERTNPDSEPDTACSLAFALAQAYKAQKDFERSFQKVVLGNQLLLQRHGYQMSEDVELFERLRETAPHIAQVAGGDHEGPFPIFIFGMPRSGTTLVEQIISAHSDVSAGGELLDAARLGLRMAVGADRPSAAAVRGFRRDYLATLTDLNVGQRWVTDKMPHNFRLFPLLAAAIPEARFVLTSRDARAVCWSNFWQYFDRRALGYSMNLETCVTYFGMYERLVSDWESLLPGRIYHLDYEKLVVDQEAQTRSLIAAVGLTWDDACLAPQNNARAVKTASKLQVRSPIYTGSSEAWRAYEPNIGSVFDPLET